MTPNCIDHPYAQQHFFFELNAASEKIQTAKAQAEACLKNMENRNNYVLETYTTVGLGAIGYFIVASDPKGDLNKICQGAADTPKNGGGHLKSFGNWSA